MKGREPFILLSETSPNGNIQAIVEQDDRVAYFYLWGEGVDDFGLRACWVRNLAAAPSTFSRKRARRGEPPMLPKDFCAHPNGAPALKADRLSILWFEEGDAAALLEDGNILAVIPGWSGRNGFHGFARDHIGDSDLAWELGRRETNVLFDRLDRAREFWRSWDETSPWQELQERFLAVYTSQLGPYSNYYAIDGGNWPPRALLRIPREGTTFLVTLGMSIRPQPTVELRTDTPELYRRIELGACFDPSVSSDVIDPFSRFISAQADRPWSQVTFLGHGHTIECNLFRDFGSDFTAVLLAEDPPQVPQLALPAYRDDTPKILWMIPITESERELAMRHGSAELLRRLSESDQGWVHMPRESVA